MPTQQATVKTHELKLMLDRGDTFVLLDVRNQEEFERWRIESRHPLEVKHVPYFRFVEDPDNAIQGLPKDRLIVAVCAKGGSSAWVVNEVLRPRGFQAANLEGGMLAWGSYYQVQELPESSSWLHIYQFDRVARGCLHHIIAYGPGLDQAVVIDPPRHTDKILDFIGQKNLKVTAIIDTHAHADHVSGGVKLSQITSAPYYLHPYDGIHPMDVLPATFAYEMLKDGMQFDLNGAKLTVLHIPGHTLGNTALFLESSDRRYLFSGDSIFLQSIARPDLGGRAETWTPLHYKSLYTRLLTLPDDTIVLPGHYSRPQEARADGLFAATLGELKRTNADLRTYTESEFRNHILSSLPQFPPQYVDIKRVNLGLLAADADRIEELELGKNVCALATAYKT